VPIRGYKGTGMRAACTVGMVLLMFTPTLCGQISSDNPSQILQQYRSFRGNWMTSIWPYANTLFGLLAVIEFAWSAAVMALEKADLQSWTSALTRKIMWLGAFYALLLFGRQWIPAIIDSFSQLGGNAAGINGSQGLSPSDVFTQGLNIAAALMDAASSSAFFTNPGTCIAVMIAAALVVLAFVAVCIQYIVAVVESYIVVAAGVIFLGFGGSRWTTPYVERYIGLGVSTGIKIMILYMLIGVGMSLSGGWLNEAAGIGTSPNPSMTGFDVMGAALIFMMLCWQIPKLFAAVLGGSPALSGGDLVATATGVVAGAAAVSSFATGAGAAIAGGAASVANAAGSSGAAGASSAITSVNGAMGSSGRTSGGTVPPPPPPSGPSPNGHLRQPGPPTNGPGGSSRTRSAALSSVGGESLAGSGFEEERPASGFTTFSVPITPPSGAATNSRDDSPRGPQPAGSGPSISPAPLTHGGERPSPSAGQTQRVLSGLTGGLRRARSRFGGLPSDAASHATPPRMPIEHDE
jgi:type IV secretion system protein TrbL